MSCLISGTAAAEDSNSVPRSQAQHFGRPANLPLPSRTPIAKYETLLFQFLNARQYVELGWKGDKRVRDTGPLIQGRYFGTHPAVRVYYSPEIMQWLIGGRKGPIPDGAMLIKEQYDKPATRHLGKSEAELWQGLNAWTIMVKDSQGSYDGWFWSNPQKNAQTKDNHQYNFKYPVSGFGHYCLRCHASTQSPGEISEYTFASLRNIAGFPGEPVLFRIDDSWIDPVGGEEAINFHVTLTEGGGSHPRCTASPESTACAPEINQHFLRTYSMVPPRARREVQHLPPVTHDWVVRAPRDRVHQQAFVTSNQCMSCHAGLSGDFGPSMLVYTTQERDYAKPARDFSPYAEWRWSPMGLAGRDPVFFAQMEFELALLRKEFQSDPGQLKELTEGLVSTCLRCHAVMGKRQWELDHGDSGQPFGLQHVHAVAQRDELVEGTHAPYGALARDGISCMVCHRMQPRPAPAGDPRTPLEFFLETSITGNFVLGPPNEIYGPFRDDEIVPYAMEHALGLVPKHNAYIQSSRMCGSCHTVSLPIVERPFLKGEETNELVAAEPIPLFRKFHHHVEQATYLEWLNSEYENEYEKDNPRARSCQDCHMSRNLHDPARGLKLDQLRTRIAIIQDDTYPEAENLAPHEKLHVRIREQGYARHNFVGLNAFLVEMFQQFDDILGVSKVDSMTGIEQIPDALANFKRVAQEEVAALNVTAQLLPDGQLQAEVLVQNKVGHRFPSGVGFRRAFLELVVVDRSKQGRESVIWSSGRTNDLGVIVDDADRPLPSEFLEHDPQTGRQHYQPHHELITRSDQVQIYEVLLHTEENEFTTSFIHGCHAAKDNRLLPKGWRRNGRNPDLKGYFLKATYPGPGAIDDPRYTDGSGSDAVTYRIPLPPGVDHQRLLVKASLYYQALPPYYLNALFRTAPDGPATQRLHYICSNIKLKDTLIEDWKLLIASEEAEIDDRGSPASED